MDAIEFLVPRILKPLSAHYKRKAARRPVPVLPDGIWDYAAEPGPHYTVGYGRAAFTPGDVGR